MKKTIITKTVLLLLIIGLLAAGNHFRTAWTREKEICDQAQLQLQQVTDRVAHLEQKLTELTLDNAHAQTAQAQQLQADAEKLSADMEALQQEIDELTLFLEENKNVLENAEAEQTYLQGVYDALEDGLRKVEEYLAAD